MEISSIVEAGSYAARASASVIAVGATYPLTIDVTNRVMVLAVNDRDEQTIALPLGTYDVDALAGALGALLVGGAVDVDQGSAQLRISTSRVGEAKIEIVGGSALGAIGFEPVTEVASADLTTAFMVASLSDWPIEEDSVARDVGDWNQRYLRGESRVSLVTVQRPVLSSDDPDDGLVDLTDAEIYFTVRSSEGAIGDPVIYKTSADPTQIEILDQAEFKGRFLIKILSSDTNKTPAQYRYDVWIKLSDAEAKPVVRPSLFEIKPGVTILPAA